MSTSIEGDKDGEVRFQIYRGGDGRPCDLMTYADDATGTENPAPVESSTALDFGNDLKVLFDKPGLSLIRLWFKSGYPLPRHTHNVDCLYYITGGSIRMGAEVLRAGDGFFVGAHVPYTYVPGDNGVEMLEIRPSNAFDIKIMGDAAALRDKSITTIAARQAAWAHEKAPPSAE